MDCMSGSTKRVQSGNAAKPYGHREQAAVRPGVQGRQPLERGQHAGERPRRRHPLRLEPLQRESC
jgi:hypothetical protein